MSIPINILMLIIGAVIGLIAKWIWEKKTEIKEQSSEEQSFKAILTALYSARNYTINLINEVEEDEVSNLSSLAQSLRASQEILNFAIEKSSKKSQIFLFCLAEWKLHLENYCLFLESSLSLGKYNPRYTERREALCAALDQFDFIAHSILDFISEQELTGIPVWKG